MTLTLIEAYINIIMHNLMIMNLIKHSLIHCKCVTEWCFEFYSCGFPLLLKLNNEEMGTVCQILRKNQITVLDVHT